MIKRYKKNTLTISSDKRGLTVYKTENPIIGNGDVSRVSLPSNINISDIFNESDIPKIKSKPVKIVKIGNGSHRYDELKAIIILENGDFVITDNDVNIIDYVVNS